MEKAALEPLVKQGLSTKSIAKLFGTSQTNVRYWVRKHGLQLRQKSFGAGYTPPRLPYRCGQCGETDSANFMALSEKYVGHARTHIIIKQVEKNVSAQFKSLVADARIVVLNASLAL